MMYIRQMSKIFKYVVLLPMYMILLGCGMILNGPKQDITVTVPSGATVVVGDQKVEGSKVVKLERKNNYTLVMMKNGETRICGQVKSVIFIPIVAVDVVMLLVPAAIDYYNGSWSYLEPENVKCIWN